jgi:hypothetical protein|tara:strand:- start:1511 stop:1909 length:399 start_codon:yes stop_codon:yes gene_type:complete
MSDKKKIVRASDASAIKRFAKEKFGTEYLADMTDKELQALADMPGSVFDNIKRAGAVAGERARRKALTDEAYPDAILRDFSEAGGKYGKKVGRAARDSRGSVDAMVENIRRAKRMNNGAVMKKRGGTFKGTF